MRRQGFAAQKDTEKCLFACITNKFSYLNTFQVRGAHSCSDNREYTVVVDADVWRL